MDTAYLKTLENMDAARKQILDDFAQIQKSKITIVQPVEKKTD